MPLFGTTLLLLLLGVDLSKRSCAHTTLAFLAVAPSVTPQLIWGYHKNSEVVFKGFLLYTGLGVEEIKSIAQRSSKMIDKNLSWSTALERKGGEICCSRQHLGGVFRRASGNLGAAESIL